MDNLDSLPLSIMAIYIGFVYTDVRYNAQRLHNELLKVNAMHKMPYNVPTADSLREILNSSKYRKALIKLFATSIVFTRTTGSNKEKEFEILFSDSFPILITKKYGTSEKVDTVQHLKSDIDHIINTSSSDSMTPTEAPHEYTPMGGNNKRTRLGQ